MKKKTHPGAILTILSLIMALLTSTSCSKKMPMTTMLVQDSIRHYYPLVQGTDLTLLWRVANAGQTPLVLSDIQPSCGCVISDPEDNNVIPPGKDILLKLTFRSEKNTGYVRHTIRLYGNIAPKGMACLIFDLNVVPPALGSPDYEEQHKDRNEYDIITGVKTLVDGEESQRGYWTDEHEYSRGYNRYYWWNSRK